MKTCKIKMNIWWYIEKDKQVIDYREVVESENQGSRNLILIEFHNVPYAAHPSVKIIQMYRKYAYLLDGNNMLHWGICGMLLGVPIGEQ